MTESTASEQPARPSTTWGSPPPLVGQQQPVPRTLAVSFWLWLSATVAATVTGALALIEFDRMHSALYRLAAAREPGTDAATLDNVATLAIAVLVGGSVLVAILQLLAATAMRRDRGWARVALVILAFLSIVYGLLVIENIDATVVGGYVVAVQAGTGVYILLMVAAIVAMFGRRT